MQRTIALFAVLLISASSFAEVIQVTKHQKSGVSESRTTMAFDAQGKGKCMVAIETEISRTDEKDAGADICKSIAKAIGKIKVARDKSYVQRFCPASYEKIATGMKEKFYCLKGKRTDGKSLIVLNRALAAIAAKNFQVDF